MSVSQELYRTIRSALYGGWTFLFIGQPSKIMTSSNCFPFALCMFMPRLPIPAWRSYRDVLAQRPAGKWPRRSCKSGDPASLVKGPGAIGGPILKGARSALLWRALLDVDRHLLPRDVG